MGLLDQLFGGGGRSSTIGLLDPELQEYMRQQRGIDMRRAMARGMMQAGLRGARFGPGLLEGLAAGANQPRAGLLNTLRLQEAWENRKTRRKEGERQKRYEDLVSGGSGYDPASGVTWNQARPGNPDVTKGMSPVQRGMLSVMPREAGMGVLAKQAFPQQQTPPAGFRRTNEGFEPVPGGPASLAYLRKKSTATRAPATLTGPQKANNAEIDAARRTLSRMSVTKDEILRRTQKATNTGRENPDFDPFLERVLRQAAQRKTGADPGFRRIYQRYYGAPPPAIPEPQGPGQLDRMGGSTMRQANPPGAALSTMDAPAIPGAPGGPPIPRRRPVKLGLSSELPRSNRIDGRSAKPIGRMAVTDIDDLLNARGDNLTPAELQEIEARLNVLMRAGNAVSPDAMAP